jgi:hypothetical protein
MTRWYRAYEGTVTDAKLGEVSLIAECSRSVAIAAWHCILESAATSNAGGAFDASPRRVAVILYEKPSLIEAVFDAFRELGMIQENVVTSWKNRQYESDSSTERARKHRQAKRDKTKRNGHATLQKQPVTSPDTEADTEKEVEPKGSCASDDAPDEGENLKPEHVMEKWNELAGKLGKPMVRNLTPERRQLLKARIAQYDLDDFISVFGKVERSPFLRGDTGWNRCTFDWIFKKANFQKALEGNYDH